MTIEPGVLSARKKVKPVLVYWHCETWWNLDDGPCCPMEHDDDLYSYSSKRGRKRRVWLCLPSGIAYFTRDAFLGHDEEECW